MPAYLIVIRNSPVTDPDAYAEYQRRTRANQPPVPVTPLVAHGAVHPLEGDAPAAVVVLRFDSVDDAQAWYNSDAYQEALPHRLKAGEFQSFIVEGLMLPGAQP
jgi:uncharacterized protein (DUF1330 family)